MRKFNPLVKKGFDIVGLSQAELEALFLKLDQTTPQTITGGIPLLTNLTPTSDYHIATKKYVDESATPPGGVDTNVQYNDNGSLAGDSGLTYNKTTQDFEAGGKGTFGGAASGQSTIDKGLVVNDGGGGEADDDFRAETNNEADAFVVDASADEVRVNVISKLNRGLNTIVSTNDVSNPPTDAELDSAFGTPAALGAGFVGILDDNSADTDVWLCYTSDTSWFYLKGTKAV